MRVLLVISDLTLKIKVKQTQVIFRSGFFSTALTWLMDCMIPVLGGTWSTISRVETDARNPCLV